MVIKLYFLVEKIITSDRRSDSTLRPGLRDTSHRWGLPPFHKNVQFLQTLISRDIPEAIFIVMAYPVARPLKVHIRGEFHGNMLR